MPSYNHVCIVGNLTRDPELKYLQSGTAVSDISIAVNESFKGKDGEKKESVNFFDCTLFGRTAEVCAEYCHKGSTVLLDGRLKQDQWQDKETGKNRSKVKIIVERLVLLGGKNASAEGHQAAPPDDYNQDTPQAQQPTQAEPEGDGIPF